MGKLVIKKESPEHEWKVGDIFKTPDDYRLIIKGSKLMTVSMCGHVTSSAFTIAQLMDTYNNPEFIGRLEIC